MRVLHVLEAVRGGTSRHLVDVVRHTGGFEHHVALPLSGRQAISSGAEFDREAVDSLLASGAVLHDIEMRRSPPHPANATAVVRLRRLARDVEASIVHGHSAVGGALARLSAIRTQVPVLYTPNGIPDGGASIAIERLLGRLATRLVAASDSEAERAIRLGLVDEARVVIVRNGVDLSVSPEGPDLRRLAGVPPGAPLVGTVARLVTQKAPVMFVEICAEVRRLRPDAHFLLIGMGPLQDQVDSAVERAGIVDRWHQIRHLSRAAGVLGQLDVFVLASEFEGGPYSPLEAMRAATPVVLSDVVGNRDTIEPGVSGLLAPFGDASTAAAHVASLLSDEALRAALIDAARRRLEECFDIRVAGEALATVYRDVIGACKK